MTVHSHNIAIGYTQTLGSATVLDLRAGVNRFTAFRPSNGLGFKLTTLGLPASLEKYMQEGDVDEFPGITAQGYSNLGNNNGPYYSSNQTNYNFSGSILRVIGKHSLSFGGEHRDYFLAFFQTNPLLMNFANDMTQGPDPLDGIRRRRRWRRIHAPGNGHKRQRGLLCQAGERQSLLRGVHAGRHQVDAQADDEHWHPSGTGDCCDRAL